MGELDGKAAIVTGGANGLGRATVERFVAEGARVVVADIDADAGEALVASLGDDALFCRTDVTSADDVQAAVDATVARYGRLDIMINNAGIPSRPVPDFLAVDLDDFDGVMRTNLFGVMVGTQRAARQMVRQGGGGVILNTASIAGLVAGPAVLGYRLSKVAVIHFSKCAAIELAAHGIRVNAVAPGHIRTPLHDFTTSPLGPDKARRLEEALQPVWDVNKPLKRFGVPEDVAQAFLFLASDRASIVTGIVMPVDAGISIGDPVNHLAELLATQQRVLAEEPSA